MKRLTATFFTREANPNVLSDSLRADGDGLRVQMTEIRASPDKEGWSIRVSLELRKGTWSLLNPFVSSCNASKE